jgi:urea transport system substrate-binding protein
MAKYIFTTIVIVFIFLIYFFYADFAKKPIRIGILHSFSGVMASIEKPVTESTLLAIEELNAHGGLLGRKIEIVWADGKSDPEVFAKEADRLINVEHVSVIFGCWTSKSRNAVKAIVEKNNHLLFYPAQYEGFERSPNIIYTGTIPNQQVIPATNWATQKFGKKVYLIGSDRRFPHVANLIIHDMLFTLEGKVLGEKYVPIGEQNFSRIVDNIKLKKPDLILNSLTGDSNLAFFLELERAGLTHLPIVSFNLAEEEFIDLTQIHLTELFAVASYFPTLTNKQNQEFVASFKKRFGNHRITNDPMAAGYIAVNIWAEAIRQTGTDEVNKVNGASLLRASFQGPSSIISVDTATRHLWKMFRIAKLSANGQFEQVFNSDSPLRPSPWPVYRSKEEWVAQIENHKIGHPW